MSEIRPEETSYVAPSDNIELEETDSAPVVAPAPSAEVVSVPAAAQQRSNRSATIEHLAARRASSELSTESPEVKQKLNELRTELTLLVTDLRWGGQPTKETAERIIPFLNEGPLQQWIPLLVPTILEIDRAGDLAPAWLYIITAEISELLGKLAIDPRSSLYATRSLVKQSTVPAMKALAAALKDAEGWAKVDVIDAFATLNQARFYEIMLASGLERTNGLESYIAVPLFRTVPLETYLRGGNNVAPRLTQQAAMVVSQVLQDSMNIAGGNSLPPIFERDLPTLATALYEGTKRTPNWQLAVALHRLGLLLGRYWGDISRGTIQDQRIIQPVYACLPMMPDIEHWMNYTGRDVLWEALTQQEEAFLPTLKVLSELRDPRTSQVLIARLDATTQITDREHAISLGQICDTLVQLGDRSAVSTIRELVKRTINSDARATRGKRRDNLDVGDADIPGSIVYGAAIRTFAQFGERSTLDVILRAANDFDPYVRTQALEALKSIDPQGEDARTCMVVREALNDPRDTVVRVACQLITQYHDIESVTSLRILAETRPEFAPSVQETLRQLV